VPHSPHLSVDINELAVRAAWMYHDHGYTQAEIATRLGVSRSTISRALQRATDIGIVEVRLTVPLPELAQLEADLLASVPALGEVTVAAVREGEPPREATARATARLLESLFTTGAPTVAIGWGRTLARASMLVHPRSGRSGRLVDAIGHAHSIGDGAAMAVSTTLANAFGVATVHLPVPAMVRDPHSARVLAAEEQVRHALGAARGAEAIVVSVGAPSTDTPLVAPDLLTGAELRSLVAAGAIGDVLGCFLNLAGKPVPQPGRHWMGLDVTDLRQARRVVAVAGGPGKADAILAAAAAGVIDHLVTDELTAHEVIARCSTPT